MEWMCFICTGDVSPGESERQHEGLPGCFYNSKAFQQLEHRFWCILECTGLLFLPTESWRNCTWAQHCSLCATTPQGSLPSKNSEAAESLETSSLSSAGAFPGGTAAGPGPGQLLTQTACHTQLARRALIYIILETFLKSIFLVFFAVR